MLPSGPSPVRGPAARLALGLRANLSQFALLVLINAFVGGMVGLERTVVPLIGAQEFHLALHTAILSFIASFDLAKAASNLVSGVWADAWGRKRVLVLGWLVGVPVPFLLMLADSWGWVVLANVLLGLNQGMAWSMTVTMKMDLVGPAQRGLATGLNEFAGYLAVGLTALATGYIAAASGRLRPEPFYLGVAYTVLGLVLSWALVRETWGHAVLEARAVAPEGQGLRPLPFRELFHRTSWKDRTLFSLSQAGLVNNLNDGMAWGLFPLLFALQGLDVASIGLLKALYPVAWGLLQVGTGPLSDRWGRKPFIVLGMWVQASGIWLTALTQGFLPWAIGALLLGLGTAMVYPVLLAAVGDVAHPSWRARALGTYRFWRDVGYAFGALGAGLLSDLLGITWAIAMVGVLTFVSGLLAAAAMTETRRSAGAGLV